MKIFAFVALSLTSCAFAEVYYGSCPDLSGKVVTVSNLEHYMGTWYEIQKFSNFFERGLECNFAQYTLVTDSSGTYVNVNNTGWDGSAWSSAYGKAVQTDAPYGSFIVTFGTNPYTPSEPNYNLLALNTSSYALVYGCSTVLDVGAQYAWVLSREKTLSSSILDELNSVLTALGVDISDYIVTDQSC